MTAAPSTSGTEPTGRGLPSERPIQWSLLPDSSTVGADGHLSVGGVDLVELAEEVGTPVFVYDEDQLRARCREAVAGFVRPDGTLAEVVEAVATVLVRE